jgi:putative hydrolase of the HAD superfamily
VTLPQPAEPAAPVTGLRGLLLDAFGVLDDSGGAPGATPVLDVARGLRQRGVRVALVSNVSGPAELREAWRATADAVVCSGELGVAKPAPGIFRAACARLGLPPAACVFVDDSRGHVRAAVEQGLVGVHHHTVETTLAELAALFPG